MSNRLSFAAIFAAVVAVSGLFIFLASYASSDTDLQPKPAISQAAFAGRDAGLNKVPATEAKAAQGVEEDIDLGDIVIAAPETATQSPQR
ncbi:MAG: hypothetical protein ONB46_14300 [candidate division KSB1 bacterium]|nr:hypothetical protein [candidate division KSB1 bacterium]MDZ7366889.1 hypothetical protein [candidate division KSB1 bacterium]MDZ7406058.1 hypothetical protein [candidate division KSB1 bacterium]